MGFPNIPNITPSISVTRQEAVNLLLASIAFEELGLAHIGNAEAEKIQSVIGNLQSVSIPGTTIGTIIQVNKLVNKTLEIAIKKEMLLQFKLENVIELITETFTTTTTSTSTSTTSTTATTTSGNCGGCSVRAVLGEGQSTNFTGSFLVEGEKVSDGQGDVNIDECGPDCKGNTDTMKFNSSGTLMPSGETYTLSFNGNRSQLTCSSADGTFMLVGFGKVTGNNPFPNNSNVIALIKFTSPDVWHVEITDGTTTFVADFNGTPNPLDIMNCPPTP